jgi:hypothetical protein
MIFDVNKERATELARSRGPATAAQLGAFLQVPSKVQATILRRQPDAAISGMRVERLAIGVAPGLELPALLIHPAGQPRGTVVVSDGRPPAAADAPARARSAAEWAGRGYLTLAVDVRGAGALAPTRGESGYTPDYQLAADAWLLGTSVVAWQTQDLMAALTVVEGEEPSASQRVIDATGLTGPAAIFAAALHPVTEVRTEDGIVSYLDLASTRFYKAPARAFVPGILKVADLKDAMTLAAPAAVHLVRPVHADGTVVTDERDLAEVLGGAVPANVRLDTAPAASR